MAQYIQRSPWPPRKPSMIPTVSRYPSEGNLLGGTSSAFSAARPTPAALRASASQLSNKNSSPPNDQTNQPKVPKRSKKKISRNIKENVGVYENWTAILNYQSSKKNELTLRKGEPVQVLSKNAGGWWFGQVNDRVGIFPSVYVAHPSDTNTGPFSIRPLEIDSRELKELEVIGVGGFGRVYRGIWRKEEVALKKIIRDSKESVENARERVRREAKLLCLLHHPNIILLKGVCLQEPNMCLVIEYARGGSLFKVLRRQKLTLDVIVNWAIQIAKGMHYLHEEVQKSFRIKYIMHRDLKSHNILVSESLDEGELLNKTLKITDFGHARQATQASRMSNAGTYAWSAPESVKDHEFSKHSDVWSYGVVLWEMLTGEVPYDGYEPMQIVYAVGCCRRLPIPGKCPSVFQKLLNSCWELTPKMRPLFKEILGRLEGIEESPFVSRHMASFKSLQVQWHQEIQQKLEQLRARDDELNERAEGINRLLQKQQAQEKSLNRREQELYERELEVFEREITVMIREQNLNQTHVTQTKKKSGIKTIFSLFKKKEISPPQDFKHLTEVTEVTYRPGQPSLKINHPSPSPGTPHSDLSSPTEIGPIPTSPGSATEDNTCSSNTKGRYKKQKCAPSNISGKSIWYTTLSGGAENSLPVASEQSRPTEQSVIQWNDGKVLQSRQNRSRVIGDGVSSPSAPENQQTLVMTRKPTIDYDRRRVEAEQETMRTSGQGFSRKSNNGSGNRENAPRRPSTLDLRSIATPFDNHTLGSAYEPSERTSPLPVYQWGTMNVTIDSTPGKTVVTIGSTPTPGRQNFPGLFPTLDQTNRTLTASGVSTKL